MARTLRPYQSEALAALRPAIGPRQLALLHIATGGGKTCIANALIDEHLTASRQNRVLWVTKDGPLLDQALLDLEANHPTRKSSTGRIGAPQHTETLRERPENPGARVTYTTLQTLASRHERDELDDCRPTLIVWDECHWADSQRLGRCVRDFARMRGAALLGLTATPRAPEGSIFRNGPAYSKPYASLVEEGFLARHEIETVQTNVSWTPRMGVAGDITQQSVEELADSAARNKKIVARYCANQGRYGKTLVFACGIAHANKLGKMFRDAGIPCEVLHQDVADKKRALQRFRDGKVQVLVNVTMLTHGIDIPSIRTVFLCRPTASDILFMQMVGRASRLDPVDPSKKTYTIVEFNDNVQRFGEKLVTTGTRFGGLVADPPLRSAASRAPRRTEHAFDPDAGPLYVPASAGVPEALHHLWYRQKQTFGVEIELTRDGWQEESAEVWAHTAECLRQVLVGVLGKDLVGERPCGYGQGKSDTVWNVEKDGSCGWEITSRILEGQDGLVELAQVCQAVDGALTRLGLRVAPSTGLHVHLAWKQAAPRHLPRLLHLVRLFEPGIGTLVAASRLRAFDGINYNHKKPNEYAAPVSRHFPAKLLRAATGADLVAHATASDETKYGTVNVRPLKTLGTVEVRMHSGTTEIGKIAPWVSLWMQLLWEAERGTRVVPATDDTTVITPSADIVQLAQEWLSDGRSPHFSKRLIERRAQVVEQWRVHPDLEDWLAFALHWAGINLDRLAEPTTAAPGSVAERFRVYAATAPSHPRSEDLVVIESLLIRLERDGILRNAALERGGNGWGYVVADRPEGRGPVLQLFRTENANTWVYRRIPEFPGYTEQRPGLYEAFEPRDPRLESSLRAVLAKR